MAVVLIGVPCKICKKGIPPSAATQAGNDRRGFICEKCKMQSYINYMNFTDELTAIYQSEKDVVCPRCNHNLDEIARLTGLRSLFAHHIDGILAMLCKTCSDYFIPRSGQFGNTEFGKKLKIAGYK